jgi:hypothetical protein
MPSLLGNNYFPKRAPENAQTFRARNNVQIKNAIAPPPREMAITSGAPDSRASGGGGDGTTSILRRHRYRSKECFPEKILWIGQHIKTSIVLKRFLLKNFSCEARGSRGGNVHKCTLRPRRGPATKQIKNF